MFEDIKNVNVDAVIVHKLDRFSRDRFDSFFYKRELKKHNMTLISVLENIDGSPESIIMESVLIGMAEYYSKNLAREVMKGHKETALKAKHNGGSPPLGYDVDANKTYILNEREAQSVRLIFNLYMDGNGYNTIINELNRRGFLSKNGNKFGKNSLYDILQNEKYTGTYVYNKRKDGTNRIYKANEDIIKIENAMPEIISRELYDAVQDKMKGRKRTMSNKSKQDYILTGHIFCGKCNNAYVGNSYHKNRYGTKYYIYSCTNRKNKKDCDNKNINKEKIEDMVVQDLKKLIFNDIEGVAKKSEELYSANLKDKKDEIKTYSHRLADVQKRIDKLLDAYLDGTLDKETYSLKSKSLTDEKNSLVLMIEELTALSRLDMSRDKVAEFLTELKNKLESNDPKLVHSVIQALNLKVLIYPDHYMLRGCGITMVELNHTQPYPTPTTRTSKFKLYKF
jgi:site-specific DNA recombinase